jgi:hypothetical protein
MAKKKVAKKAAPSKKAAKAKPAKKKTAPAIKDDQIEIMLEPIEKEALDLVQTSNQLCNDLEVAVTSAVSQAVRKVFKSHKVALSAAQAENVALILFGN